MAAITTADVRAYIVERQAATQIDVEGLRTEVRKDGTHHQHVPDAQRAITGASNAEINRELTILKRIFNLAVQAGKLLHKPHIPLLREDNTRTGFFELGAISPACCAHLPAPLQPVIEFAYITGWRIAVRGPAARMAPGRLRRRAKCGSMPARRRTARAACSRSPTICARCSRRSHAEHQRLKQAGQIVPVGVLPDGRRTSAAAPKHPQPIRRVHEGVGGRLHRGRLPWSHPA